MTLAFEEFTLAASTADLAEEPAAREHADCVEFRMDLAGDDPLEQVAAYLGELPLLVTNRPAWEGGEASDDGRLEALAAAVGHDAVEAVDVELAALADGEVGSDGGGEVGSEPGGAAERLLERAEREDVSVVVSTHDFEETPPRAELDGLLARAGEAGDVAKLAVTAVDRRDTLALLAATQEADGPVATVAMGEAGRHTRAVAPLYGSRIGYAPVDPTGATAPGQYDLETLRGLVDRLR